MSIVKAPGISPHLIDQESLCPWPATSTAPGTTLWASVPLPSKFYYMVSFRPKPNSLRC